MDGETRGKYHQASPDSLICTKVQILFNDCFIVKNQDSQVLTYAYQFFDFEIL